MDILLAVVAVVVAVVAWTAWEASMVSRLSRDDRPLARRNAAVAGAHRLTVVGQLGLVAVAVVAAGLVEVPLWWNASAVSSVVVGGVLTAVLVVGAAAATWWTARRGSRPQDRRALLALATTAFATEVLLRGLGLGLLDAAGWPVTAAVLVTSVATGLLQAARARVGSRAFGFVLATLLGFVLGLVVLLTGSVLAAAAIHLAVVVVGLGRTFPARGHAPGCACGHDHGTPEATSSATSTAGTSTAGTSAAGTSTAGTSTVGTSTAGTAATTSAGHDHAHGGTSHGATSHAPGAQGADGHASCGTTCDHAGTSACAVCPLSTARV